MTLPRTRISELLRLDHPVVQGPFGGGLSSLDLAAAVVAILTTVLVRRWRRLATPPVQDWPAGWRLVRDQRIGNSASPRPITEPVSSPSTAVS